MKALSIKQPWAWLIVNGIKDIENRSWKTKFRGRMMVHASKTLDKEAYERLIEVLDLPKPEHFEFGKVIGEVDLVDVVVKSDSNWFDGSGFGFVLQRAEAYSTKDCFEAKGRLGFFDLEKRI